MRNPPGHDGFRQAGTEKRLIDPPHNCPSDARLSTPKTKFLPPSLGGLNGSSAPALAAPLTEKHSPGLRVRPALSALSAWRPSLVMVRIEAFANGTFRPNESGEWAITVGVNDRDPQLVDIVAFFLKDINCWWLRRRDQTPVLGADRIDYAIFYRQPLTLYQTPYDWLLERGNGAVVLDWGCDLRDIFEGIPKIQCRSISLGKKLRESYAKFQPVITTPTKEKRHAA